MSGSTEQEQIPTDEHKLEITVRLLLKGNDVGQIAKLMTMP